MWREKAALRATVVVTLVVLAACVLWAVAAQSLVPNACELRTAPPDAGPVVCPTEGPGE